MGRGRGIQETLLADLELPELVLQFQERNLGVVTVIHLQWDQLALTPTQYQ
jgi:hypothetical protein